MLLYKTVWFQRSTWCAKLQLYLGDTIKRLFHRSEHDPMRKQCRAGQYINIHILWGFECCNGGFWLGMQQYLIFYPTIQYALLGSIHKGKLYKTIQYDTILQ